jgi:hypothetical protein
MHSSGVVPGLDESTGDRFSFMFGVGHPKCSVREIQSNTQTLFPF